MALPPRLAPARLLPHPGLALLLVALLAAAPARAQTYSSTDVPKTDAASFSSTLTIPASGSIQDLDVSLDISHGYVNDLTVTLRHPGGTTVTLVQNPLSAGGGNCIGQNMAVTLSDEAASGIQTCDQSTPGSEAYTGTTYRPANDLSGFDGQDVNGTWTLTVTDGYPDLAQGILNGWSITASVASNQAPTDLFLSNNSVAENAPAGTAVGTLSTTDPDGDVSFTYTLGGADAAAFAVVGNELRTSAVFNFESKATYTLTVRTTDGGGLHHEESVTVTVQDVENANLNALALSAGTLSPAFAAATTDYTASVANGVTSITVTPTHDDPYGHLQINGVSAASGSASDPIPLAVGPNTITVWARSESYRSGKTYTVVVTRAGSSNADLSGLTLSDGTLDPVFAAGTTSYTATTAASSIDVTATLSDATATMTIDGTSVPSGVPANVPLTFGANTITTQVTAQDGSTKTYTVDVTRTVNIDGDLTAAGGVSEPVGIGTTSDTPGEAVDVFDVTLTDGGGGDGLPLVVSEVRVNVSGSTTDADRAGLTFRLHGPDASGVTGSYSAVSDRITFSSLPISVADGGSETYTLSAYWNDPADRVEDRTLVLSVDGDTDLTVSPSGTQMGATSAVTNASGSTVDVVAAALAVITQPAGSTSGNALATQPVVVAVDAFGNRDVDFTETITLTESSAGTLSGDVDVAAVHGVATFTDVAYTATADGEPFTLTADDESGTGTDLPSVDANAVTSDVVATRLVFETQPAPLTVASGEATSFTTVPVVRAVDASGVVDTGYGTDIVLAETDGAGSAVITGTGDADGSASTVSITPSAGTAAFTGLEVTYTASGASDETFRLTATSGGLTTAHSSTLTAVVNRPPVFASGDQAPLLLLEDAASADLGALLRATDADAGTALTWRVVAAPSKGTLAGFPTTGAAGADTPSGLTYTPSPDANGSDRFDVEVTDGEDVDLVEVHVTLTPVNDAPSFTAGADQLVAEDAGARTVAGWIDGASIDLGPGDEAGQHSSFEVTLDRPDLFAVAPAVDAVGTLTYTPADDAAGEATLSVVLRDDGGTANGGVDTSAPQTVTITITPVNDAPVVAVNAGLTVPEGDAATLTPSGLSATDPDDGDGALTYTVTAAPVHGRLERTATPGTTISTFTQADLVGGAVRYVHDGSETTADAFTFDLADAAGTGPAGQTLAVTVDAVNDAPTLTPVADQVVAEDGATGVLAFTVTDAETDAAALTVHAASSDPAFLPPSGLALGGSGAVRTIRATPALDGTGSAVVTLTVSDGGLTATETFTVSVASVNDAPSFTVGADVTVPEDAGPSRWAGWAEAVSPGPADEQAQTLAFTVAAEDPSLFASQPSITPSGTLSFTPTPDVSGSTVVTVQLLDDGGTEGGGIDRSDVQTFTVTIASVNDAPMLALPGAQTVEEDGTLVFSRATGNAITVDDPDADLLEVTLTPSSGATLELGSAGSRSDPATLSGGPDGSLVLTGSAHGVNAALDGLRYRVSDDETSTARLAVRVSDRVGSGPLTDSAVLTISILPVNDAPTLTPVADQVVAEDGATGVLAFTVTDAETDAAALTVHAASSDPALVPPSGLTLGGSGGARTLTVVPAAEAHGTATITLTVSDGGLAATAAFTVTVTPVNDAPSFAPRGAGPVFSAPRSGEPVVVDGRSPEAPFVFRWAAAADADDASVRYGWELARTSAFDDVLARVRAGDTPEYETTWGALAGLLDSLGVEAGATATFYHRVWAEDADTLAYSPAEPLVVMRGALVGTESGGEVPADVALAQNYPNPFNPQTTIRYALPEAASVRLELYDALGRRVRTLVAARQAAGWHELRLDAGDLPSGTYLYRLVAGDAVRVRTLLLSK